MDMEKIVFELIACAGNARSDAFEALAYAREGNFEESRRLLKSAKEELLKAHGIQNDLIFSEANGQDIPMKLILVHAEDHLMSAILAKDLIEEMIHLYEKDHKSDETTA
jgi:PTS system cellobiose-specific IIA component